MVMIILLYIFLGLIAAIILFPFYVYFIESRGLPALSVYLKLFYKIEVDGLEHMPKEGPCLLACNHFSYLDWLIVMKIIPRPVHFVIHYRFYYAKGVHYILKKVGAIPISGDGERPKLIKEAFVKVSEDLNQGSVVLVFPEGGITRNGKPSRFRKGIVRIKEDSKKAPLIPMSIDGLWGGIYSYSGSGLFSLKKLSLKRRVIRVKIYPELKGELNLDNLRSVIFSDIQLQDGVYLESLPAKPNV